MQSFNRNAARHDLYRDLNVPSAYLTPKLRNPKVILLITGSSGAGKSVAAKMISAELNKHGRSSAHIETSDLFPVSGRQTPWDQVDVKSLRKAIYRSASNHSEDIIIISGLPRTESQAGELQKCVERFDQNGINVKVISLFLHTDQNIQIERMQQQDSNRPDFALTEFRIAQGIKHLPAVEAKLAAYEDFFSFDTTSWGIDDAKQLASDVAAVLNTCHHELNAFSQAQ